MDLGVKIGLLVLLLESLLWPADRSILKHESTMQFKVTPKYTLPLSIRVFAWRRKQSLERLLKSLLKAHYHGHRIPLHIHIDGEALDEVAILAQEFEWPHGRKHVHASEYRKGMPAVRWRGRGISCVLGNSRELAARHRARVCPVP